MTVWLLNAGEAPVKNVRVALGGRAVTGTSVRTVRWGPDTPREGADGTLSVPVRSRSADCGVPPMTLLCLEFEVE